MPENENDRPQFHPDNVADPSSKGKHCWHPVPPASVGFRNRHSPNEMFCCHCDARGMVKAEPQSWHGPFASQEVISAFLFIEGHRKDERCPGPPPQKPRLVLQ